jgi:hypothetical protein
MAVSIIDVLEMDDGKIGLGGLDWIGLSEDRDQWRALVKASNEPFHSLKCWEV